MADDKVQVEIEPIISPASVARIKQQMAGGPQGGGLAGGMPGMGGMGMMAMGGVGLAAAGGAAIGGAALASVGTANPAAMERFNQAMEDITGVIGQSLVPVLDLMTEGARMFGDFLASIIPDTSAVFEPLHEVMEALKEAIDPLIPLIKDFLAGSLEVLANVVRQVADAMVWLLNKLGVSEGKGTSNWSSSVGAAVKGSSYESAGDLNKGAIAGAYGMGGGANPAERTAKSAEKLAADVAKIVDKMYSGTGGDFGDFPNE